MPRFLRYLVISLSMSAVVALLFLVATLTLIDPNDFKGVVRQHVLMKTGKNLSIAGNVRWRLRPHLSLELNEVKVTHASPGRHDFITIQKLRVIPKFNHILSGHVLVDMEANGVHLNLEDNEHPTHWADLSHQLSSRIVLNSLTIDNAALNYQHSKLDERLVLEKIRIQTLNLSEMRAAAYAPFQIAGQWRAHDKTVIDVTMQGEWHYQPHLQHVDMQNITIQASNNMKIQNTLFGTCCIEKLFQNPRISGKIHAANFNFEKWWSVLALPLPPSYHKLIAFYHRDNPSLASMQDATWQIAFQYQGGTWAIPNFQVNVPNGTLFSGNFNWPGHPSWLTGKIHARQIQIGKLPCPELRFRFKASPSIFDIEQYEIQIEKQKHFGHLKIDLTESLPNYTWLNETKDADLEELLFLFGCHHKLYGKLSLKTELKTRGLAIEALKQNLNGTATMVLHQGQIPGINLLALLSHTDSTFKKLQANWIKGQPTNLSAILTAELLEWRQQAMSQDTLMTPFERLEANFTIGHGIIKNDAMNMNHAKFQLTGHGAFDLENNALKFESSALLHSPTTLMLQPIAAANQSMDQNNTAAFPSSVPLNILIQGPLENVSIRPALEHYAQQMLKLNEEVKQEEEEDKTPQALEKLFGFP